MKPLLVIPQENVTIDSVLSDVKSHEGFIIRHCYVCVIITNSVESFKRILVKREDVLCMIYDICSLPDSYLEEFEEVAEISGKSVRFLRAIE